jgi:hypothetical protein
MAEKDNRWNGAHDSLRVAREAFHYEAKTFQLELVKTWRGVANFIHVALGLRTRPSVLRQDMRLSRVLFRLGRTGLLVGIGQALPVLYPRVEDQLPERLARMLKQLEEMRPQGVTEHPSKRAA